MPWRLETLISVSYNQMLDLDVVDEFCQFLLSPAVDLASS